MFRLSGSALPLSGSVAALSAPLLPPERCVGGERNRSATVWCRAPGGWASVHAYLAADFNENHDAHGDQDERDDDAEQSAQQGGQFHQDGRRWGCEIQSTRG